MSAAAEVGFFLILLVYALTGLTYNFKKMDEFMCVIWIAYFLFSFRHVIKFETKMSPKSNFILEKEPIQVSLLEMLILHSKVLRN